MALTAPSFKIKFDLTNSPKNFEIEDTTDYPGNSVALVDVRGCITSATDPVSNTIYANTDFNSPDIEPNNSVLFTGIDIPTDVNGDITEGDYSFTYGIKIDNPIIAVNTGAKQFTIAGNYASLISSSGSIKVVRSTGNNNTYTVVSAVFGGVNTVITVSETVPSAVVDGSIQYADQTVYSATNEVTYNNVIATINIDVNVDCFCGSLTSIDATSYGSTATILSRTHTVKYPAALEISDITSSNAEILVSPIYTKTWTTIVESTVSYDLGGGNTIEAIITGSKDTVVDCDLSLCEISCGVIALNNRYKAAVTTNRVLAAEYFEQLNRVFQLVSMFRMQLECGQNDEASQTLSDIRVAGNFTSDCGCDNDSEFPTQIVPMCSGAGTNVIVTQGTGITVTSSVNGNTVTYQVSLSNAYITLLNSLKPVNVVGGTGISVVKTTPGGVDTYTVTSTAPFVPLNSQQARVLIQYSNFAAPTVSVSANNIVREGSNMTDMTVASGGSVGVGLWKYEENYFVVNGFQVVANSTYKPFISIVQLETQTLLGAVTNQENQYLNPQPIDVRILDTQSGEFKFQFVEKSTGLPLSNYAMVYNYAVLINIEIKE